MVAPTVSRSPVQRRARGIIVHSLLGCRRRGLLRAPEAEQRTGDAADLDLFRTLGDAVTSVMAIDVLERRVARIADAAMDLHGAVGGVAHQAVGAVGPHRHPL